METDEERREEGLYWSVNCSPACLASQTRALITCDKLPTRSPSLRLLKYLALISCGPLSLTYPKPMARRSLVSNPGSKNACHGSPADATSPASASKTDRLRLVPFVYPFYHGLPSVPIPVCCHVPNEKAHREPDLSATRWSRLSGHNVQIPFWFKGSQIALPFTISALCITRLTIAVAIASACHDGRRQSVERIRSYR
jgi:hypothetical protein